MRSLNPLASSCRHCGSYVPEGRRGGHCQKLSVPVQGAWKACPLTIPPFAPSWESLEEAWLWQEENCISDEEVLARSPQSTPEPTTIRSESMASTHCD